MSVSETTTTVFIIDDDDSVRKALARLMRSAGYNVEVFGSAEEFLSSERMSSDCLLVLDIRMPGMSGIQLRQYLKDAGAELTIIFITGYEDQRNDPCIAGADVVDLLYKPFDGQKLLDAIHVGLQRTAKLSNSGS
jgi:FixJ family two-component response regulator